MTACRLSGKPVALELTSTALGELSSLRDQYGISPTLAIVQVGEDPGSTAYRKSIVRVAEKVSVRIAIFELPDTASQDEVNAVVHQINADDEMTGAIILQPLPDHISRVDVADRLDPLKDIDGVTTFNAGRLFHDDRDVLAPSTPAGGMALLKHYDIPIAGKRAVVVGRSPVVGKPMALMLLAENATVSICHSRTERVEDFTRQADIVVAAAGQPGLITGDMIKPGATVVDFGVNFPDGKMIGDVDGVSVEDKAGALTPVPGGTGLVTRIVLIRNLIKAAELQHRRSCLAIS